MVCMKARQGIPADALLCVKRRKEILRESLRTERLDTDTFFPQEGWRGDLNENGRRVA